MTLSRQLSLTTLVCIVVANMIGAGVFTTSGFALAALGSQKLVMAAWITASLVALCGALAYGELSLRNPESGGEYLYLSRRLHPFAGFLSGWVSLTAGFSGPIAASALTFEEYLVPLMSDLNSLPAGSCALVVVVICGLGHSLLQRPATALQNLVVIAKLLALGGLLLFAAAVIPEHTWYWQQSADHPTAASKVIPRLAEQVMWISFSFAGFNAAVYVAGEASRPELVPRALLTGTAVVAALYLLLNLVFVTAAPASFGEPRADIAAVAAKAIGGTSFEQFIRGTIAAATLSSVAVMTMIGPRVYARMADDGVFFRQFSSDASGIRRGVLLQTGLAAALVLISTLRDLISYLGVTLSLSSALTVFTLLMPVRHDEPGDGKGPRSSGNNSPRTAARLAAATYLCATLLFTGLMATESPRQILGTVVTIALGSVLWFCIVRRRTHQDRRR